MPGNTSRLSGTLVSMETGVATAMRWTS